MDGDRISDGRIGNDRGAGEGKDGMHAGAWADSNRSNDVSRLVQRVAMTVCTGLV